MLLLILSQPVDNPRGNIGRVNFVVFAEILLVAYGAAVGVDDPYTPAGIASPATPSADDDICNDHTFTSTWRPEHYSEKMRRVQAAPGSGNREHKI